MVDGKVMDELVVFHAVKLVTTVPDQLVAAKLESNQENTRSKISFEPLLYFNNER